VLEDDRNASGCENLHIRSFEVRECGPCAVKLIERPEHLFIQPEVAGLSFGS
jgi:hypothetical protein